jgi:hypothetical protein
MTPMSRVGISEHYFSDVASHIEIKVEHVEAIVRCFDTDRDGFLTELKHWLHSRGVNAATVLALAQAEAEAQPLPHGVTWFHSGQVLLQGVQLCCCEPHGKLIPPAPGRFGGHVRNAILLVLEVAVAVGACGHPAYGRPSPRDTLPTTKEPGKLAPGEKPVTKELNRRAPSPAESPARADRAGRAP